MITVPGLAAVIQAVQSLTGLPEGAAHFRKELGMEEQEKGGR